MLNKEEHMPSVEDAGDKIHRIIRASIGLSPIASGTILEAFNLLWRPPVESRAEKWMADVIDALNELAERQGCVEYIVMGEEFQSLLISANQLVLKHHQPEKVSYFKNAVINGITNQSLSYDKKITFLTLLDELTVSHLNVLRLINNGILWGVDKETTESRYPYFVAKKLFELFPELSCERLFFQKIVQDLSHHNLVNDIQLVLTTGVDVVRVGSITNTDIGVVGLEVPFSELPDKKIIYKTNLNGLGVEFINYISEMSF
ncbi:hypothetical protein [Nitrincola sp. MINF-07-Sa-05]|uniref:hypothetical protein n=1 Tax=Nitrincola salilacus TaxID=3400273 RepID=UPI0039184F30